MSKSPRRRYDGPCPTVEESLTMNVEDAGRLCGFGRAKSYQEANRYLATDGAEGLPVIKFGRTMLVPTAALRRLLQLDPPKDGAR